MEDEIILEKATRFEQTLSCFSFSAFSGGKQTNVQTN
jgi:hypothetical protein